MTEALQDVIIRSVREDDSFGWLIMRKKLWPDCPPEEHKAEIKSCLRGLDKLPVFVAEQVDGNLVGFLEASIHHQQPHSTSENVLYIEGWYVEPAFRKRDIGRMLLEKAELWGRLKGFSEVFSDTEHHNTVSQKAHASLGFVEAYRNEEGIFYKKMLKPVDN
ncbi:GNAT family N-acetyltransferase [Fulvivirgaceae bacterium PWU4]|uniref:Aminoglycoside N(6')-acetyltransferase type 1 n=1 Tax=Chryseosolibacter histidini TaxID=2782349 RepID=A0AAP2DS43_9BACT|nr:GNAT family N-acetyltransferase [Chryseosolibacter histidini]MBT1701550.1 GNAT family N-acetyltransferase [Chryseosolibacter histidini]